MAYSGSDRIESAVPEQSAGGRRYPDFIIGGAPKCGTTSLHFILDQHDDIAIPHDEVHFFDADDPVSHPDFLRVDHDRLVWWSACPEADENLAWYAGRFDQHGAGWIGEDSTTYLMSEVAPARIHAIVPDVKLIFMLRHPVERAYSQYWHLVKTARTTASFEQALIRFPQILLGSGYATGLRRFYDQFGRDQVKVCLFEDFRNDNQACVDEVTAFIGAPKMQIDLEKTWFNKTKYPASLRLQRAANVVGGPLVRRKYRNHMETETAQPNRVRNKLHYWWFKHVNARLMTADRPLPMSDETRAYLEQHLSARNAGLSELLGRDLRSVWQGIAC
ncbi:sulfotransferase family protein [Loktanella sp. S4079]|uniref:sulfotransferase family protein n=1 Tax=Loktanella sp. S4079 TaxID=579483 RepID=UPI0005FA459E|nr:sulfotransferase [Loktanella sp. S4079]KJZ18495.1 hypothetical protein TW80_13745 [Loktanella sp. S4079]